LTAQKFLPDPFRQDPTARLYRTGDLVYRVPDGNLIFLGRVDRQVKIRGFRIEPEEIEATLQRCPGVGECAVTTDSRERLVAYITWPGPEAPFADALRLHLSRSLPAHMIPGEFLVLDDMPHTFSGKIDFQALPRLEATRLSPTSRFQPPSTPTEKRVAALWQEALGISCMGVTDDFFHSGGDSLSATVLITLIEREFDREISLASLVQASTIARLAAMLESDERSQGNASRHDVIPLRSEGSLLPLLVIAPEADNAIRFLHVCRHLGNDQPFFVLRNPAGDSGRLPTVEARATEVCQTIRAARLNGPYLLGGYCLGGIVAFEAAHQLLARGEDVRMVVLFDTPAPGYPKLLQSLRAGVSAILPRILAVEESGLSASTFPRFFPMREPLAVFSGTGALPTSTERPCVPDGRRGFQGATSGVGRRASPRFTFRNRSMSPLHNSCLSPRESDQLFKNKGGWAGVIYVEPNSIFVL
jgi:acyl carrier protein